MSASQIPRHKHGETLGENPSDHRILEQHKLFDPTKNRIRDWGDHKRIPLPIRFSISIDFLLKKHPGNLHMKFPTISHHVDFRVCSFFFKQEV